MYTRSSLRFVAIETTLKQVNVIKINMVTEFFVKLTIMTEFRIPVKIDRILIRPPRKPGFKCNPQEKLDIEYWIFKKKSMESDVIGSGNSDPTHRARKRIQIRHFGITGSDNSE